MEKEKAVKVERRYFDEEDWQEISLELAMARLSQTFSNPEEVLAETEANEKARPGSGIVRTPYALYRVSA